MMDLFAPQFSVLALIGAVLAGYVLGTVRNADPRRAIERARREQADQVTIDQAYQRLPEEKRRDIERLARSGKLIEAIREARLTLGCGLKEAKELVERWAM